MKVKLWDPAKIDRRKWIATGALEGMCCGQRLQDCVVQLRWSSEGKAPKDSLQIPVAHVHGNIHVIMLTFFKYYNFKCNHLVRSRGLLSMILMRGYHSYSDSFDIHTWFGLTWHHSAWTMLSMIVINDSGVQLTIIDHAHPTVFFYLKFKASSVMLQASGYGSWPQIE